MFTSIFSSLTSLLPKNFIFGSYIPILVFATLNTALMSLNDAAFRAWVVPQVVSPVNFTTATVFVGSIVVAYIFSSVTDFLREVLEGKHIWPVTLAARLRNRQRVLLSRSIAEYERARSMSRWLTLEQQNSWIEALTIAARAGVAEGVFGNYSEVTAASVAIAAVRYKVDRAEPLSFGDIGAAVEALSIALRRHDLRRDRNLSALRDELSYLIDYSRGASAELELRAFGNRQTRFGNIAEPTTIGNIAASINAYAANRYNIDLDIFWSRLQYVLQKSDDKAYESLAAAKAQLDFLVLSFWLLAATTAVWDVALAAIGSSWLEFVLIALIGPLISYAFYLSILTNYLAYGEIVRGGVDLNRFAVLESLQLPRPAGVRDERATWRGLRGLSIRGAGDFDMSYAEPIAPPK